MEIEKFLKDGERSKVNSKQVAKVTTDIFCLFRLVFGPSLHPSSSLVVRINEKLFWWCETKNDTTTWWVIYNKQTTTRATYSVPIDIVWLLGLN